MEEHYKSKSTGGFYCSDVSPCRFYENSTNCLSLQTATSPTSLVLALIYLERLRAKSKRSAYLDEISSTELFLATLVSYLVYSCNKCPNLTHYVSDYLYPFDDMEFIRVQTSYSISHVLHH